MSRPRPIENNDASTGGLSEEKLLAYLEGRLSGADLQEVEGLLADENMESDALEGLQQLDADETRTITTALNTQLQQSLKKKNRRGRRGMLAQKWSLLAVVIILLLAIACYAVIWVLKHP